MCVIRLSFFNHIRPHTSCYTRQRGKKRRVLSGLVTAICAAMLMTSACRRSNKITSYPGSPIILISVDTLRADHLPAYGYKRVRTPAIDKLRSDSILFRNAYSHCPLTFPSHVSVLTGLLPNESGVRDNAGYRLDTTRHPTIASLLRKQGYASGAAVSAYVLRAETGLGADFDWYDDETHGRQGANLGELQRRGEETTAAATRWIEAQSSKPFFLFLHLFEPHSPYEPPEPYRSAYASSPYDGEIASTDEIIGHFLDGLRSKGIYDRATVIFMSDHGEGLSEHGEEEHGIFLYREAIHVPLMVKLPEKRDAGTEVTTPVQLSDIFPTIAQVAGVEVPVRERVVSLLRVASDKNKEPRRIYSETFYPQIHYGWSRLRSLVDEHHHYIEAPSPELYDLAADPRERSNILTSTRRVYTEMRNALLEIKEDFAPAGNVSAEEAAKLAALGYLGSSATNSGGPLPDPKTRIATVARVRHGTALLAARRPAEAAALFKAVVESDPEITDAWAQLGKSYEQLGEYKKALASYQEAIRKSPSAGPKFALAIASIYLYLNDMNQAEAHAKAGYLSDPHMGDLVLGIVALERGDYADAEKRARSAMTADLYRDSAGVLVARSKVRQGRPDEALRILEDIRAKIMERKGDLPPLMEFVRGDALMRLGRVDEADAAFRNEIKLYPKDREAYASLAAIYLSKGDSQTAETIVSSMLRANPEPSSYALAAQLFGHFGDRRRAQSYAARSQGSGK